MTDVFRLQALAIVCGLSVLAGCGGLDSGQRGPIWLQLSVDPESALHTTELNEIEFELKVSNEGRRPVDLDQRGLALSVVVEIRDAEDNAIDKAPGSFPADFTSRDVVRLEAGRHYVRRFSLRHLTFDRFAGSEYSVMAVYDNTKVNYVGNDDIFGGRLISSFVKFRRQLDGWRVAIQ